MTENNRETARTSKSNAAPTKREKSKGTSKVTKAPATEKPKTKRSTHNQ